MTIESKGVPKGKYCYNENGEGGCKYICGFSLKPYEYNCKKYKKPINDYQEKCSACLLSGKEKGK